MIYESIYKKLIKLGILNADGSRNFDEFLKMKSGGMMDLNLDMLHERPDTDSYVISIAHNYVQNGDVMADPDMEVEIHPDLKMAEALTFQNSGLGLYQRVYEYNENGKKTGVRPSLKKDLNSFLLQWLRNIDNQGFKPTK